MSLIKLSIAILVISILIYSILDINHPRPVQDDWPEDVWEKYFSSEKSNHKLLQVNKNGNLATKKSIWNSETKSFEYGRYHHDMTAEIFENIDFSLPLESYNQNNPVSALLQKLSALKEWSYAAFTDGEEWFCGTALSTAQLASGIFVFCYNSKTGRAFHLDDQSVVGHAFGYGTNFRGVNGGGRTPYANNGFLEWDMGRISNDHHAWAKHGYNSTTKEYQVHARVTAHEYILDEETEYKTLTQDFPVVLEFEFSFPLVSSSSSSSSSPVEGLTVVYPTTNSPDTRHRIFLTTKYSGIQANVKKFSILKKTGGLPNGKGPKYEAIFDFNSNNNNNEKKKNKNFVAFLDWTRSQFPRHTVWYWVCFGTTVTSKKANIIDKNQQQQQQQIENNHLRDDFPEGIQTRIGLQVTALSYRGPTKHGKNYSMESALWINGSIFTIDAEVEFIEDSSKNLIQNEPEGRDGREKMKQKLGRSYTIRFDTTKNYLVEGCEDKDFWILELSFVRRGAHVQDFGEYWPLHFGALHHQWGEYTGELTHFVVPSKKQNEKKALQLNHVYRFANVPGVLEDHDTWW